MTGALPAPAIRPQDIPQAPNLGLPTVGQLPQLPSIPLPTPSTIAQGAFDVAKDFGNMLETQRQAATTQGISNNLSNLGGIVSIPNILQNLGALGGNVSVPNIQENLGVLQKDLGVQPQAKWWERSDVGKLAGRAVDPIKKRLQDLGILPKDEGASTSPGGEEGPGSGPPPFIDPSTQVGGGPGGQGQSPADYSAISNRFAELMKTAQRQENRQLEQTQNALARKFAGLGMSKSGESAKTMQLASGDAARNMADTRSKLMAEQYGQMAQLDEAERGRRFASTEAGKERTWKSGEAALDRYLAQQELDLNKTIAGQNLAIARDALRKQDRGIFGGIITDILGEGGSNVMWKTTPIGMGQEIGRAFL